MKNIIIGTAGHVDHGKTELIKALSGIDTDRLSEEKKRGITIELGFANIINDEGYAIGVIDVPGHEKFIKNMLAGIGGIDFVLFVVAADEGVMPQTTEHFEILQAMGIDDGIIAITKKDMVDDEWLEVVENDIREHFKGSFLEGKPMIAVSSKTGENIDVLKKEILKKCHREVKRIDDSRAFRLPVDRVFTMPGFGTVVTGTLIDGRCKVGESVVIYPEGIKTTIRGIQNFNKEAEEAYAGQRTAVNLRDIKKDDIGRGDVIAAEDAVVVTSMIDAKLKVFDSSERTILNNSRVHLYTGASESIAKVIILDRDAIGAGEEAYVQFRMEKPVALKRGDRFILRFYSPIITIAGGLILDADPVKHKRNHEDALEEVRTMDIGNISDMIKVKASKGYHSLHNIAVSLGLMIEDVQRIVDEGVAAGSLSLIGGKTVITSKRTSGMQAAVERALSDYHGGNPLSAGMPKRELMSKLAESWHIEDDKLIAQMISFYLEKGVIHDRGKFISLAGFAAEYTEEQKKLREDIANRYEDAGIEMPSTDEIMSTGDRKTVTAILEDLLSEGRIVKISPAYYISIDGWNEAVNAARQSTASEFTLADYRDALGTSRKYAAELLSALDRAGITKRDGDKRIIIS